MTDTPRRALPTARLQNDAAATLLALAACGALTACTWVEPTTAGSAVVIATSEEVADCTRIGRTTSRTMDNIGPIDRAEHKVRIEVQTLARNEAADMGGDTIVPEQGDSGTGVSTEGTGAYLVYRCVTPAG